LDFRSQILRDSRSGDEVSTSFMLIAKVDNKLLYPDNYRDYLASVVSLTYTSCLLISFFISRKGAKKLRRVKLYF